MGDGSYLRGTTVLAMHDLALVDPRTFEVATAKRVRRKLTPRVKPVPAKEGDRTTCYEGIRSQRVADAIRECSSYVMRNRLLAAVDDARREGIITREEYDELRRELNPADNSYLLSASKTSDPIWKPAPYSNSSSSLVGFSVSAAFKAS